MGASSANALCSQVAGGKETYLSSVISSSVEMLKSPVSPANARKVWPWQVRDSQGSNSREFESVPVLPYHGIAVGLGNFNIHWATNFRKYWPRTLYSVLAKHSKSLSDRLHFARCRPECSEISSRGIFEFKCPAQTITTSKVQEIVLMSVLCPRDSNSRRLSWSAQIRATSAKNENIHIPRL